MTKHYVGEIGLEMLVLCSSEDISAASSPSLKVRKPDGTEVVWNGTVVDKYYIRYITQEGDLDQAGTYKIHSYFALAEWSGLGEMHRQEIYEQYK